MKLFILLANVRKICLPTYIAKLKTSLNLQTSTTSTNSLKLKTFQIINKIPYFFSGAFLRYSYTDGWYTIYDYSRSPNRSQTQEGSQPPHADENPLLNRSNSSHPEDNALNISNPNETARLSENCTRESHIYASPEEIARMHAPRGANAGNFISPRELARFRAFQAANAVSHVSININASLGNREYINVRSPESAYTNALPVEHIYHPIQDSMVKLERQNPK